MNYMLLAHCNYMPLMNVQCHVLCTCLSVDFVTNVESLCKRVVLVKVSRSMYLVHFQHFCTSSINDT